jgi:hypothetical protein
MKKGRDPMVTTERFEPQGEVAADDRARIAFGKIGVHGSDRFAVSVSSDGEILLTPVASIPKREMIIWENDELRDSLLRGLAEASAGKTVSHGSFAEYASEPESD